MTTLDLLRSVAGHGLSGPREPVVMAPEEVDGLLVEATAHKLIGLLDQAVADGAVECDAASAGRVGERAVAVAAWSVQLERHLLAVHALFDRADVPHRFVKGATVAHRFYAHPGLRMSVDVDVLVEPHQLDRAVGVLEGAGHVREQGDPYPGFSRRYAKSVTVRRGGMEVDVHRVVPDGPFGLRASPDVLWAHPGSSLSIGGRDVPALHPVAAFVQACVNAVASYDLVSLASLRDVAQVGTAVADQVPAIEALAGAMGVRACLTDAVTRTTVELGWLPPAAVAAIAAWPVSAREREWLDSYRVRPSDRRRALLGLHAVPGVRAKAAYLVSVAALSTGRPARRRARSGPGRGATPGPGRVTVPRVLLVAKGLDIGGIERIVVDLAVGLARRGAVPEVAVVNDRRDGLLGVLEAEGVTVHRLGGTDRIGGTGARRLARLATSRRFDVVHVHGPLPAVVARVTPRHRPIITTSHTLWGGLRMPVQVAWRATAPLDAATVAVSAAVAASLPKGVAERTRVIPHGVDPDAIAATVASAAPRPERPGVVTAVAVASHRDVKNYPNLLRAVRAARDAGAPVRLVAVGEGPDLERHRSLARQLGLADVVTFVAPRPDALGVIADADLLVVASDFEGQPLVVSEALALGRPVVATAVGRVPELVSPAVGRIVPPDDPAALGAALAELVADHDLRRAMGAAALEAGRSWTLPDVVDAHLSLYAEVGGECRGGGSATA